MKALLSMAMSIFCQLFGPNDVPSLFPGKRPAVAAAELVLNCEPGVFQPAVDILAGTDILVPGDSFSSLF